MKIDLAIFLQINCRHELYPPVVGAPEVALVGSAIQEDLTELTQGPEI